MYCCWVSEASPCEGPAFARRLARDRDPARVAAEGGDVALHPPQRGHLVEQAVIAVGGQRRGAEAGHVQEAEHAEPVVEGHHDDVVGVHDQRAVMLVTGPVDQPAAVDHDEHRKPAAMSVGGREHVEEQAVLGVLPGAIAAGQLRAAVAVGGGAADAVPRLGRLRRLPAQRSDRGRGIGNAEELIDALGVLPLQLSVHGRDDQAAPV